VELDGSDRYREGREKMGNLIWIIVVVLVVLALLGYFGRGRLRR
jgi:flagellar basal body-associated protein FliL